MNEADELEFLRYFYNHADNALGPASDDVYTSIQRSWEKETGKKLGSPYASNEAEEGA